MSDRATLSFELGSNPGGVPRQASRVGRMVILGDFSGAATAPGVGLARHPVVMENLNERLNSLAPSVQVELEAPLHVSLGLTLKKIDDFHPDNLINAVPQFQTLLSIQRRLASPEGEATALAELSALTGTSPVQLDSSVGVSQSQEETDSGPFQRLLGTSGRGPAPDPIDNKLDQIVRSALKDVTVDASSSAATKGQQEILALLTESMRAMLNLPQLKRLESNWLGIDMLLRGMEDEQADIELIDLSWDQLKQDLQEESGLENTDLYHSLMQRDEARPDLVIGLYSVRRDLEDLSTLSKLSTIAGACGATLAVHGDLSLCGCTSTESADTPNDWSLPDDAITEFWQALRSHAASAHLSLLTPRFLLRYPYGRNTNPVETFAFEELAPNPEIDRFSWGNPALIYALCWASGQRHIEELPMPIYETDSGNVQQPPVEVVLNEHAAEKARDGGLVALRANSSTGTVMI